MQKAARARPAVTRWHFAMRRLAGPLDCPLRPSGRLEVYAVDLRLPPFGKLLAAYLEHKARLLELPHRSDNASRVDSENLAQMRLALEVGGSAFAEAVDPGVHKEGEACEAEPPRHELPYDDESLVATLRHAGRSPRP